MIKEIKLTNLKLVVFDKDNYLHVDFLKDIIKDETILRWFQGITNKLLHNYGHEFFDRSFFVADINDELIGFINIGDYNEQEKCVYLRAAIHKSKRGKGIGTMLLNEITTYIFDNYNQVDLIKLKIDQENKASINQVAASGYKWLYQDYYGKYNPHISRDDVIR